MANQLPPTLAAQLALDVYDLNSGNQDALNEFLDQKIFNAANKNIVKGAVGGRVFRAAQDAFGVCAQGAGIYQGDLFLIFRGTTTANNKADFITDARIGITHSTSGLPVHIGFNHTFNSMLSEIRQAIVSTKIINTVHCIGHSLGGAVASLAADWVSKNTVYPTKLYTFGSPRVGTEIFVKSTTNTVGRSNMHRTYHRTDPVAMVALYPFMQAPYGEAGHYVYSAEPLTSGDAHSMSKYLKSVNGLSWEQLSTSPDRPCTVESEIESWLKSTSPIDSSSPIFWQWVESALIYVLKKISIAAITCLQGAFIGIFTLADKISYILAKGIDLTDNISIWVEHLMRKLMQALSMKVANNKKELTHDLIKYVLIRVTEKAHKEARNALKKL